MGIPVLLCAAFFYINFVKKGVPVNSATVAAAVTEGAAKPDLQLKAPASEEPSVPGVAAAAPPAASAAK